MQIWQIAKKYVSDPYTVPEQTVNPNGTIYTKVLAAPQEMSVKNIHVDIQKGQTALEISPKQYLKLVNADFFQRVNNMTLFKQLLHNQVIMTALNLFSFWVAVQTLSDYISTMATNHQLKDKCHISSEQFQQEKKFLTSAELCIMCQNQP